MTYTGCWIWDVRRKGPAYWSAEMFRIHGRDPAEGLPSLEEYRALHRPEDWSGWMSQLQRCIEERADIDCTCEVAVSGGLVRHVQILGHPVIGAADMVTEIIGFTVEVNGQSWRDLRNQTSEDRLRTAIDLIPTLRESERELRQLVDSDVPSTVSAMKAGAIEFLEKPADPQVLLTAIRAAFAKDREQRQKRADRTSLLQRFALLTPREREVLPLVVSGMLNKQAAALLDISDVTLQVHRGQIMRKMEANSFADLVRMAGKLGIPEPD